MHLSVPRALKYVCRRCAPGAGRDLVDGASRRVVRPGVQRASPMSSRKLSIRMPLQHHPKYGPVYAYEVDGFGNALFMDDANVPSLLSLPYLGWCAAGRSDVSRHTGIPPERGQSVFLPRRLPARGSAGRMWGWTWVWPMSIIIRALTSTDEEEILRCLANAEGVPRRVGIHARVVSQGRSGTLHAGVVRLGQHAVRRAHPAPACRASGNPLAAPDVSCRTSFHRCTASMHCTEK